MISEYDASRPSLCNISVDPQGRIRKLTRSRVRREWQARRGWTHYVGFHDFGPIEPRHGYRWPSQRHE